MRLQTLEQGLALVEQYQRTGEDRGKYTTHIDAYKSKYRIEIEVPDTDVEAELKAYHDAALAAFKLFADAYLTALARLQPEDDAALISGTKAGTEDLSVRCWKKTRRQNSGLCFSTARKNSITISMTVSGVPAITARDSEIALGMGAWLAAMKQPGTRYFLLSTPCLPLPIHLALIIKISAYPLL